MLKTYPPSKILQPYIAFFYTLKCQKSDYDNIISEFCLPSGFGLMGFHFCGSFYIVQKNQEKELPRFYAVGQQTHNYSMNSKSETVELYGITFQPTGLWHLFGLDMPSIADQAIATQPLFENSILKFTEKFEAEQTPKSRIKLIEKLLLKKFLAVQPQSNIIESSIEIMNKSYGCCSINTIVKKLRVKERYFQKKFKKMIGITPSAYNRIVRFNFMFAEMKSDVAVDYKSMAALFKYYDFSHFSKDFKKYCGICPSKFHIDKFNFLQELMASEAMLFERQNLSL